jgi:NADH dehydrogenase/NADH:ubiquinone oxidoreductase subunit G
MSFYTCPKTNKGTNIMSKAKINRWGWNKQKALAILVASVLFDFSFMFSSCKQCGKKANKPDYRKENKPDYRIADNPTPSLKPLTPEEEELMMKVQSALVKAAKAAVATRVARMTKAKIGLVTQGAEAERQAKVANDIADSTEEARGSTDPKIANVAEAIELLAKYATWQAKEAVRWGMAGLCPEIPAADADMKKAAKVYDDMRKAYPNALGIAKDAYEKAGGKKNDL